MRRPPCDGVCSVYGLRSPAAVGFPFIAYHSPQWITKFSCVRRHVTLTCFRLLFTMQYPVLRRSTVLQAHATNRSPPAVKTLTRPQHADSHKQPPCGQSRDFFHIRLPIGLALPARRITMAVCIPADTTAGPTTLSGWIPSSPGCGPGPPADRLCSPCLARRSPCGPHATSAVHLACGGLSQPAPRCRQSATAEAIVLVRQRLAGACLHGRLAASRLVGMARIELA